MSVHAFYVHKCSTSLTTINIALGEEPSAKKIKNDVNGSNDDSEMKVTSGSEEVKPAENGHSKADVDSTGCDLCSSLRR